MFRLHFHGRIHLPPSTPLPRAGAPNAARRLPRGRWWSISFTSTGSPACTRRLAVPKAPGSGGPRPAQGGPRSAFGWIRGIMKEIIVLFVFLAISRRLDQIGPECTAWLCPFSMFFPGSRSSQFLAVWSRSFRNVPSSRNRRSLLFSRSSCFSQAPQRCHRAPPRSPPVPRARHPCVPTSAMSSASKSTTALLQGAPSPPRVCSLPASVCEAEREGRGARRSGFVITRNGGRRYRRNRIGPSESE